MEWKETSHRKPLLLQGARQVGKTWILKAFGEEFFKECIIVDFAEDPGLNGLFQTDLKPERILTDLSVYLGKDLSLDETLLIPDEIQLCPEALTSLKYFYKAFPTAHICASGSLLGLGLSKQNFPVGKVQREWLRPMSFFEFLEALGETILGKALEKSAEKTSMISPAIHEKAFGFFKEYLIIGGMPEVVGLYISLRHTRSAAFEAVRSMQKDLAESYLDDMAKHAGPLKAMRIAALFQNIPKQLARETKGIRKFMFKDVLAGRSTYDVLKGPIQWLIKAGLIHKIPICRKIKHPLAAYVENNAFMLYFFDTGILGAMLHLDPATIINTNLANLKDFLPKMWC